MTRFRLPAGPGVRVETYGYAGCHVPVRYDPLLANVIVHAEDRDACITRLRRALEDFKIVGVLTNLPMHLRILNDQVFVTGAYDTNYMRRAKFDVVTAGEEMQRHLAAAAAVAFVLRNQSQKSTTPSRLQGGWHRSSRRLPV